MWVRKSNLRSFILCGQPFVQEGDRYFQLQHIHDCQVARIARLTGAVCITTKKASLNIDVPDDNMSYCYNYYCWCCWCFLFFIFYLLLLLCWRRSIMTCVNSVTCTAHNFTRVKKKQVNKKFIVSRPFLAPNDVPAYWPQESCVFTHRGLWERDRQNLLLSTFYQIKKIIKRDSSSLSFSLSWRLQRRAVKSPRVQSKTNKQTNKQIRRKQTLEGFQTKRRGN